MTSIEMLAISTDEEARIAASRSAGDSHGHAARVGWRRGFDGRDFKGLPMQGSERIVTMAPNSRIAGILI